jgi:hypothetical protein
MHRIPRRWLLAHQHCIMRASKAWHYDIIPADTLQSRAHPEETGRLHERGMRTEARRHEIMAYYFEAYCDVWLWSAIGCKTLQILSR